MNIDVNFSFTTDTKGYLEIFDKQKSSRGCPDPDSKSKTLCSYHQKLWSKKLPNGDKMELKADENYLTWKDFHYNFSAFWRDYLIKAYTIGGAIIFPKSNSINVARGKVLKDRFDLTLECIRLYYLGKESPLSATLQANKAFFDLFVNFKQYVKFFYLQDLVSDNYSQIKYFNSFHDLSAIPYPQTTQDWLDLYKNQLDFVNRRNQRIAADKIYP